MRHHAPPPLKANFMCEYLNLMWENGWLDEYSNAHFLIASMENHLEQVLGEKQLRANNFDIYDFNQGFALNFCINLSSKLCFLSKIFGEANIEKFVKDQLSAGKAHYNEDQFFRALSEINVLKYYGTFGAAKLLEAIYEPHIGENGKNPEARFVYEPDIVLDIEVKTPGFQHEQYKEKVIIPGLLLDNGGRQILSEYCAGRNIRCVLPRVRKLVDFINSANEKFVFPATDRHFNLLYVNWTYSEFPSNSFLEAYSILANDINGILNHKEIGIKMGVHESAYEKISAVVVYTDSLNGLAFQDFRYLWATHSFAIIPVNRQDNELLRITDMDYNRNPRAPYCMADFKSNSIIEQVEDAACSVEIMRILKDHPLL